SFAWRLPLPRRLTLFPYTTLFRSRWQRRRGGGGGPPSCGARPGRHPRAAPAGRAVPARPRSVAPASWRRRPGARRARLRERRISRARHAVLAGAWRGGGRTARVARRPDRLAAGRLRFVGELGGVWWWWITG